MNRKCVECGSFVPAYLHHMCEDCWTVILNEKLLEERKAVEEEKRPPDL